MAFIFCICKNWTTPIIWEEIAVTTTKIVIKTNPVGSFLLLLVGLWDLYYLVYILSATHMDDRNYTLYVLKCIYPTHTLSYFSSMYCKLFVPFLEQK